MMRYLLTAFLVGVIAISLQAQTNYVQNGSFEQNDPSSPIGALFSEFDVDFWTTGAQGANNLVTDEMSCGSRAV